MNKINNYFHSSYRIVVTTGAKRTASNINAFEVVGTKGYCVVIREFLL